MVAVVREGRAADGAIGTEAGTLGRGGRGEGRRAGIMDGNGTVSPINIITIPCCCSVSCKAGSINIGSTATKVNCPPSKCASRSTVVEDAKDQINNSTMTKVGPSTKRSFSLVRG